MLLIPSFSAIMGLIGATCCSLLAFILPAMFHKKLFQGQASQSEITFDHILLSVGIIGAVLGTHDALARIGLVHSSRSPAGGHG